jgi:beta-glucanase (GH16 family)
MNSRLYLILLLSSLIAISCNSDRNNKEQSSGEKPSSEIILTISTQDFQSSSADINFKKSPYDTEYAELSSGGWLAFDAEIPIAGRYKTQVKTANNESAEYACWIEDYIDNKDGRTYNITGNMMYDGPSTGFTVLEKTGSPLNAGLHKMKLHFNKPTTIEWIKFTLIRPHVKTPKNLIQETSGNEWEIVWSDEFEGEHIDTTQWTFDIGNWGWGNNELQYYTQNRPENARLENGNLIIEARKNDMDQAWTSARLTTRGKTSFTYGKIEFRAMVPAERGNWAAGWTLGDDYIDELSWPYCGEIDILESVGYEMDDATGNGIAHASAHSGAYYFKLGNQPTATTPVDNMNSTFHTYALEWTPEYLKIIVDDNHYFTYNDNSTELSWPFDKPHNIILNLAMGGGWGGAMGMDPAITSQKMIVDYVRVYERK